MTAPLIEVRGLTARAGGAVLLDGVDLDVPAGAVTALVGPSGSGKTTSALALLGECAPGITLGGSVRVADTVVVNDRGVTSGAAAVRGGTLAYMPQHPGSALNPARRTGAVLTELAALHRPAQPGVRPRKAARAGAEEALGQAQLDSLPGVLRRFPHQFSGGQRQRVALAQVLACGPRALILDEPGTGLDTVTRQRLAREVTGLARGGMAVLLLSHDHDLVRALADRVVLLDHGRVTDSGPADRLLPAPFPDAQLPSPQRLPEQSDAAPPPSPVLRVHGLTAWHRPRGGDQVLHDLSLKLPPGGCTAVAGPSGSGKTTLARCLAGLHERYDGQLALDDVELPVLRRRDPEQKRRVQYVWQEVRGSFDERRTVLAQVARTAVRLRARPREQAEAEAAALLDRLGVDGATARRLPESLSGGELQRAALARALLAEPDVLVCDEITTALDATATERVLSELERIRRAGTAVLWIGHDLALLRRIADRLLVLDGGAVVEEGDCAMVMAAPRAPTTRLLIEAQTLVSAPEEPPADAHAH